MQSVQKSKIFRSGILRKISFALLLLLTAVFYILVPYIQNEYFFFRDDYQTQYLPAFYEIGRLLNSGEFPFISTRTLLGGNFAGEYQYAVFNPVSLISYFFLYRIIQAGAEFHHAAGLIPFIHIVIIIYFINSSLNIFKVRTSLKYFSVNLFLGSGTLVHWFYGNYIPGLVSLAWFSFFLYTILLFYHQSQWRILLPAAVFLTVSSGWPLQTAALGLVSALFFLFLLTRKKQNMDALRFSFLVILGLILSAPVLMPFLEYGKTAVRSEWSISANQWRVNPLYFFQFSNPFFGGKFMWWDGKIHSLETPMLYISVFFLPFIFIYLKSAYKYRSFFIGSSQRLRSLLFFLFAAFTLLVLLSFLPNTNSLRYMFRFLPVAALVFSVWAGIYLSVRKNLLRTLYPAAGVLCILYFLQLMFLGKTKESLILLALGSASVLIFRMSRMKKFSILFFSVIQITVFLFSSGYFRAPDIFIRIEEIRKKDTVKIQPGYSIFIRESYTDFKNSYLGNAALLYGIKSLNGYSPMVERKIFEYMCMDYFSRMKCKDYSFLYEKDAATGKTGADLFDLNFIQILGKLEILESYLGRSGWKMETIEGAEKRYTRNRYQSLPDGISNLPKGLDLKDVKVGENAISLSYRTLPEYTAQPLVFSRYFWKGHTAYLDSSEIPIIRVLDFFPGIVLPESAEFRNVNIIYRPPGFYLSLSMVCFGAVIYIIMGLKIGKKRAV